MRARVALLLAACLALSLAGWGQTERSQAPKSRPAHRAGKHLMPRHAARQLTLREKQERAQLRAEQRRQNKLAERQRKEAARRARRAKGGSQ